MLFLLLIFYFQITFLAKKIFDVEQLPTEIFLLQKLCNRTSVFSIFKTFIFIYFKDFDKAMDGFNQENDAETN